jgi:leader peptidase (prepilin peptidase)/N-methyltransferase
VLFQALASVAVAVVGLVVGLAQRGWLSKYSYRLEAERELPVRKHLWPVLAGALGAGLAYLCVSVSEGVVLAAATALFVLALNLPVAIDLDVRRLPNRWTGALALASAAWLALAVIVTSDWQRGLWAVLIGIGYSGAFLLVYLVSALFGGGSFGLGDVKLSLSLGLILGWFGIDFAASGFLISFLAGGLVSVALLLAKRVGRKDALPFGPFLEIGFILALCFAMA